MLNSVVLVGRVGQDPEVRFFESGKQRVRFSLAINRSKTEVDWFTIELWGKPAEIAQEYVQKGQLVGVTGRLENHRWTDADGQKHERTVIVGTHLRLLGGGKREEQETTDEAVA